LAIVLGATVGQSPSGTVPAWMERGTVLAERGLSQAPPAILLGRSELGRPIHAYRLGNPGAASTTLVVGCVHGTECAATPMTWRLIRERPRIDADLWILPNLNPDGRRLGVRQNGRGVDLNRNFGSEWRPGGRRWDPEYAGPRPWSERETRIARRLIERIRPDFTIWYHQPQGVVRAWGGSVQAAQRFARLAGERFRAIRWPRGTAPNWQNHRLPGKASFVVELPPGPMSRERERRHRQAILRLAD
jgi:protein MpaA